MERKLTAILSAVIQGYSRQPGVICKNGWSFSPEW
jgi:hypothetical protein